MKNRPPAPTSTPCIKSQEIPHPQHTRYLPPPYFVIPCLFAFGTGEFPVSQGLFSGHCQFFEIKFLEFALAIKPWCILARFIVVRVPPLMVDLILKNF